MAGRYKIRVFQAKPFVYIKGEPGPEYRPGSYRLDGDGFWVSREHLAYLTKERRNKAREERCQKRLANQTRFGKGSGRAGGGRTAAHKVWHTQYVNADTKPEDCPLCLNPRLWKLWNETDDGRFPLWAKWPEDELLRRELSKRKRENRPRKRASRPAAQGRKWRWVRTDQVELNGLLLLGGVFEYQPRVENPGVNTHGNAFPTEFCIPKTETPRLEEALAQNDSAAMEEQVRRLMDQYLIKGLPLEDDIVKFILTRVKTKELESLQDLQEVAEKLFDQYMQAHRFEDKPAIRREYLLI